jgi:fatty-acyl-CoA synthase
VIKTGGEWVSSLDLENLISQHPAVSEAAAIGVPDSKWGERPLLVIVLKPDFRERVKEGDIRDFMTKCAEEGRLPRYAVPDKVLFVEGIPKTSVGKIDKVALRKKFG